MKPIEECLAMQVRATHIIPGVTQLLSKRPDQFSLGVWPTYYKKAKGNKVWDLDGNEYVDMSISGIGANVLGYADDEVDEAVVQAIKSGVSSSLNCPEEIELAELFCKLHPWAEMVRFARTGGEAMALAIRIARASTGRDKIVFCGYHGWHDWYLASNLLESSNLNDHLLPGLSPVGVPLGLNNTAIPFHYNNIEELRGIAVKERNQIAAIVMEPIRNFKPAPGFLEEVKEVAKSLGAVLIFDEISAGFRLANGGSHLLFNVAPDIAVFSKAIGNGYAISAIIGTRAVMQSATKSFISSTAWTERVGPTAALATINKFIRNDVSKHLNEVGNMVQSGWKKMAEDFGLEIEVGGIPPLSHFKFASEHPTLKSFFVQLMIERGFLASTIYYAMYAHSKEDVKKYLEAAGEAFSEISKGVRENNVKAKLVGMPAASGFTRLN